MSTPFACPICHAPLARDGSSLRCEKRHTFDVARQGYVNLLTRRPDTLYEDKALFQARRAVYEAGFFDPVADALRGFARPGTLLDAGCGEGGMLHRLSAPERARVGLDIAKPAIQMAAAAYKDAAWCVGDLCNLPLADASVHTLVNMLTPANYAEFTRVLAPGGVLLKVVPGAGHLREIRQATGQAAYARTLDETLSAFSGAFTLAGQRRIAYTVPCDEAMARQVFTMTPLTAHVPPPASLPEEISVDVTLLIGVRSQ